MSEKIAFLFLTRGEVNNVQVWEKYFQDSDISKYRIVIHAKNPTALTSPIWTSRNSVILKPIPTAWGTISLVKATIYLLQNAISDPLVTKFILLSEFCLPTTNFNNMYKTLILETSRSRINWTIGKNMDRYSIIKSYLNIPSHNWAKQSQWMCLDRKHVSIFLSPINTNILNQQLKDYMYCPAPDEHFFINMFLYVIRINNNEIINHPITFVDWSNNSKHPITFNTIVKDVIELCRKNKIFFARKFVNIPLSTEDINYLLELNKPNDITLSEAVLEVPTQAEINLVVNSDVPLDLDKNEQMPKNDEFLVSTKNTQEPTDIQKEAVLNFFKDVLNNLSPKRIHTIYSALFLEDNRQLDTINVSNTDIEPTSEYSEKTEETEIYDNPLDILALAIETIENTNETTVSLGESQEELEEELEEEVEELEELEEELEELEEDA